MKSVLVFCLLLVLCASANAQNVRVSPEAYDSTLKAVIAEHPRGEEMYQVSDAFARLARAKALARMGVIAPRWSATQESGFSTLDNAAPYINNVTHDTADQDETTIAISRRDQNLIVAGANDLWAALGYSMPAYVSTDAGKTWSTYRLPIVDDDGCQAFGDPMITCDDKGVFYYAFLISSAENPDSRWLISDIIVAHSSDGIHWTMGNPVVGNVNSGRTSEDKETIAVDRDPSSPYYGRVYVAWMHYSGQSQYLDKRMIAYSDDHGMTWSNPIIINTKYGYFSLLRVGSGGTVFFGSSQRDSLGQGRYHAMMVSHDGGRTFAEHLVAPFSNYPEGSYYINELKGGLKAFPYFNFDVDPDNNSIYAVYGNYHGSPLGNGYAEQYYVSSLDEGRTWSAPQQVGATNALATDHFQPWVTVDPVTHHAQSVMYSSEGDAVNIMTKFVSYELADPTKALALGNDSYDPTEVIGAGHRHPFIGDYCGADAYNGMYTASWTEGNTDRFSTGGDVYAYVAKISGSDTTVRINGISLSLVQNPVITGTTELNIASNADAPARIDLYDAAGRDCYSKEFEVHTGTQTKLLDTQFLAAGSYRGILQCEGQQFLVDIVILY